MFERLKMKSFDVLAEELGVKIDQRAGIVIPNPKNLGLLIDRISPSFEETANRVAELKQKSPVVYLPGSYDVVHIGHISYVDQVAKLAHKKSARFTVVLLADDDKLITKSKSGKYKGNGGTEPKRRPVESAPERLFSLAYSKSTLIGLIPADLGDISVQKEILDKRTVSNILHAVEKDKKLSSKDKSELAFAFTQLHNFRHLSDLPIQAIQLIVHLKLNQSVEINFEKIEPMSSGKITRFVSKADDTYLEQVRFIMNLAGIAVDVINDKNYGSTSGIIKDAIMADKKDPWGALRKLKLENIRNFYRLEPQSYSDAVQFIAQKINYTM